MSDEPTVSGVDVGGRARAGTERAAMDRNCSGSPPLGEAVAEFSAAAFSAGSPARLLTAHGVRKRPQGCDEVVTPSVTTKRTPPCAPRSPGGWCASGAPDTSPPKRAPLTTSRCVIRTHTSTCRAPPTTEVVQRLSRVCPVTGQFKFPGRGQQDTPIILVRDAVKLLQVTPGDAGDEVRARVRPASCVATTVETCLSCPKWRRTRRRAESVGRPGLAGWYQLGGTNLFPVKKTLVQEIVWTSEGKRN